MQFTENGITFQFKIASDRFVPETNSILGGDSLSFSVGIKPVQLNTFLKITLFEDSIEHIPEMSSLQIDRDAGVGTFAIKTHKLATKGILTLKLLCMTGKQKVEKTLTFNLVSEFPKQSHNEIPPKAENANASPNKRSQSTQETKNESKEDDPFSLTFQDIVQLADDSPKKLDNVRIVDKEPLNPSPPLKDPVMYDVSLETPIFLIPCQIETRLFQDQLKIRIYPDQIAIDSLQRKLTKNEMQAGKDFKLDNDPQAAWRHLLKSYKPGRAAWIVQEVNKHTNDEGVLDDNYEYRDPEDLELPKLKLLPKFFLVSLHLDNGEIIRVVGNKITSSYLEIINITENSTFSNGATWFADFGKAVDAGMAVIIDRTSLAGANTINKITVVGIRPNDPGDKDGKELLNEIFESHHYTKGVNFVKHGTPTNNTEEAVAGFTKNEDIEERYEREFNEETCQSQTVTDLSKALCLDPALLCKWENGDLLSSSLVEDFHKAMWPSTGGYYLSRFFEEIIDENNQNFIKEHFIKFVRPLGYLTSIRIGKIPYSILPVTRIRQNSDKSPHGWRASSLDHVTMPFFKDYELNQFDSAFQQILEKLSIKWLQASLSDQFPNVTSGAAEFTENEQISRILAMSPDSLSYALRRFNDHNFANQLLRFGISLGVENTQSDLDEVRSDIIHKLQNFTNELAGENVEFNSILAYIETFGNPRTNPYPLIRDSQHPEDGPEDGPEYYLPRLSNPLASINDSNTLLYKLLYRSKTLGTNGGVGIPCLFDTLFFDSLKQYSTEEKLREYLKELNNSLETEKLNGFIEIILENRTGRNLPGQELFVELRNEGFQELLDSLLPGFISQFDDNELESLLKSILDLFSFRLDAWISSLANKRLLSIREGQGNQKDEILIGAYGYVENLSLVQEKQKNSGFIHTLSHDQAKTAAILKNAFDNYTEYEENPYRINVSSDRIRRALKILEGMREGQELGALLGYQFERMLHDKGKNEFRTLFPFNNQNNNEEANSTGDSNEQASPRIVVNGLKIVEDFDDVIKSPFIPQNIVDALKDTDVQEAVYHLKDTMDAINDLMNHEAVYQAVRANYERAGAALDIASGAAFPVEPESVSVALPHTNVEHRICLTFNTEDIESPPNASPRESAEPKIAQWFTTLLGNIEEIGCTVSYKTIASEGNVIDLDAVVTIDDLNLKPIDFLYLCSNRPGGGATELESRIKQFVRENNNDLIEDETTFKLTDQSLGNLGRDGVPDSILGKLDPLKNQEFEFEDIFLEAVEHEIEEEEIARYKDLILKHAKEDNNRIDIDFENYPTITMANAIELGAQILNFLAQASFLKPEHLNKQLELPEDESETIPPSFSLENYKEIKARVQGSYNDYNHLVSTVEGYVRPVLIGVKYNDVRSSLLNEITQLLQTNDGVAPVPVDVLQGLHDYLASHFDDPTAILDSSVSGSVSNIVTNDSPPEHYDPALEILNVVENSLFDNFLNETLIAALSPLPGSPSNLGGAIESVNNLMLTRLRPVIEVLRLFGLSIDFHQQLTPSIVISIYDSAKKRFEQVNASWNKIIAAENAQVQEGEGEEAAAEVVGEEADRTSFENLIEMVIDTAKLIFGESFVVLPQFDTPERENINDAINNQAGILKNEDKNRIYLWMQQLAQTHSPVQRMEDFLLFTDAWTNHENTSRFKPNIITLPIIPSEPLECWQALCNDELGYDNNTERPRGTLNVALFSNHTELTDTTCGLHIDSWEETLPFEEVDTAIAFQADTPNQQPIHCCLIAVPGDRSDKSGFWNLLELEAIVCDTIDLGKIRGVDLDAMPDVAGLFPTIFMPADPEQDNAHNWEKVPEIVRRAGKTNLPGGI